MTETVSPRVKIEQVLDSIRPALRSDGGDVELIDFDEEDGVVQLRLMGACGSCPVSSLTLRQGIERRLELRTVGHPPLRWAALAASLLLFAVAGVFGFRETYTVSAPAAMQVADISAADRTIYWRVELLEGGTLTVKSSAPHALEAGQALELWALPEQGNPVSLGLLPASGSPSRSLSEIQLAALARAKQIAVSLEPRGGSPTGLPTGPVLHVAALKTV
jgi:anti-sigma-K factor RskA